MMYLLALIVAAASLSTVLADHPRPAPTSTGRAPTSEGWMAERGSFNACPQVPSLHCHNGSTCE